MVVIVGSALVVGSLIVAWWAVSGERTKPAASLIGPQSSDLRTVILQESVGKRLGPIMSGLASQMRRWTPGGRVEALAHRIDLAGMGNRWPVERVLAIKLLAVASGGVIGLLLLLGEPSANEVLVAAMLVLISYKLPDTVILGRAKDRQEKIQLALPDMLDQLSISVEAGLGFDSALLQVVGTGQGPLVEEIKRALQDMKMGMSRGEAFDAVLTRTDEPDLRRFVMSLRQAERAGIPIAHVLRVQSKEQREKRSQRAEEKAQKIPIKMVFPLIFCILPALFIVILGPAAIKIADSF